MADRVITVPQATLIAQATKGQIDETNERLGDLKSESSLNDTTLAGFSVTGGRFVNANNGNVETSTISDASDYVDISPYQTIMYKRTKYTVSNPAAGIAFYDSSKNFISGVAGLGEQSENGYISELCEVPVPTNSKYVRFSVLTDTETYGSFEAYGSGAILNEFRTLNDSTENLKDSLYIEKPLGTENFFRNTLLADTGEPGDSHRRICSRYFTSDNVRYIRPKSGYKISLYAYEKDYTYIGIWSGRNFVKSAFESNWTTEGFDMTKLPQDYIYRILVATTTDSILDASCSDCENVLFTISGIDFAGEQITVTYDSNSADKLINVSGQIENYTGYHYTNLLEIKNNEYYHFKFTFNTTTQYRFRIHGYDANGNWVSQVLSESVNKPYDALFVVCDPTIKYIRVSLNSSIIDAVIYPVVNLSSAVHSSLSKTESNETRMISDSIHFMNLNHRGFSLIAPENTLPAYALSKKRGFSVVECDLEWTSDNVPVLLHDSTINRTARNADGTTISSEINIGDITYAQALTYDFGIWKDERYTGTKIPTLSEFVLLCKNLGLKFMLDIKTNLTDEQIQIIADAINGVGMGEHCMFGTAYSSNLQRLGERFPKALLDYGIVSSNPTNDQISNAITVCNGLKSALNTVTVSHVYTGLTQEQYDMLTDAGINSIVWKSNTDFTKAQVLTFNKAVIGAFVNGIDAAMVIYENAMTTYSR